MACIESSCSVTLPQLIVEPAKGPHMADKFFETVRKEMRMRVLTYMVFDNCLRTSGLRTVLCRTEGWHRLPLGLGVSQRPKSTGSYRLSKHVVQLSNSIEGTI